MEQLNTLHDLFESELKDAYSGEQQMIESLPKMMEAASSPELKKDFQKHLEQTKNQAARLEEIFEMLDMEPEAEKCKGMAGIIADGEKMIKAKGENHVKDAALIAAAQKAEHYEIATYGTLREFAKILGEDDVVQIINETLKEESETDKLLTSVATKGANVESPKA